MDKSVTIRMDAELHRKTKERAFQEGVYMQVLIARFVEEGLECVHRRIRPVVPKLSDQSSERSDEVL